MDIKKKMELVADLMDMEPDELTPDTKVEELEDWDSVTKLSFIAMVDEEFGRAVKGEDIRAVVTVQDMLNLMAE